jgi:hypothetical protein
MNENEGDKWDKYLPRPKPPEIKLSLTTVLLLKLDMTLAIDRFNHWH